MVDRTIKITHEKKEIEINIKSIVYVLMDGNNACIHLLNGEIYNTRITLRELQAMLGSNFINVKRGCLVSIFAIYSITDKINLINGDTLEYATRHKKELLELFHDKQKEILYSYSKSIKLNTLEDYHKYYLVFDNMPFAFADIEMIFDDKYNAVDWIFRYGNEALAKLERVPLDKLVGHTFSSLFPNMDAKWLRTYERASLLGETLKIIDYSPEIDTYLDIICFPTFKGHCGCILFDINSLNSFRKASEAEKALSIFFERLLKGN